MVDQLSRISFLFYNFHHGCQGGFVVPVNYIPIGVMPHTAFTHFVTKNYGTFYENAILTYDHN